MVNLCETLWDGETSLFFFFFARPKLFECFNCETNVKTPKRLCKQFETVRRFESFEPLKKRDCSKVGKWRQLTYEESRSTSYPLDENFASYPPSPLEFPGTLTPPPLWNFQFPPWWGYGYFLELHIKTLANNKKVGASVSCNLSPN